MTLDEVETRMFKLHAELAAQHLAFESLVACLQDDGRRALLTQWRARQGAYIALSAQSAQAPESHEAIVHALQRMDRSLQALARS